MGRIGRHARGRVFRVSLAPTAYDDAPARGLGLLFLVPYIQVCLFLPYPHLTQTYRLADTF